MPETTPPVVAQPMPLDPRIVIEVIRLTFLQFGVVTIGVGVAMLHANWNLNPTLNGMAYMLITAEIGWIGSVLGFAIGSSFGSMMKGIQNMMNRTQPPPTVAVTAQPDATVTTTTTSEPKP